MKNRILLLIFIILASPGAFAEETRDTVVRYDFARSLTIAENEDGVTVEVIENDGKVTVFDNHTSGDRLIRSTSRFNRISCGCCGRWHLTCGGLNFGFVYAPGTSADHRPDMGKSMEIGWLNIIGLERRLTRSWNMSLGIGIDWRNYRSTTGLLFNPDEGHISISDEAPDGYRFSRIKIFSVQFPLLFTKTFRRTSGLSPAIGFGPIFNCNPHASVKTSWRDEKGKNRSISSDNVGQRKFTIDIYGHLSFGSFGIYARYSPYRILTGASSPDYRTLSAGVILFY